jgi:predicted glycosyltransferase
MKFPKIIINYDEDICSYELIKQSFFTISIGSSIAPESLILGTNHLLCGTQHMYSKLPGFYNSNESNLIKMANRLFKNRKKLKVITKNMQELCAASQLFNKDIGEEIPLSLFGKYPFRLASDNFIDRIIQNFKK